MKLDGGDRVTLIIERRQCTNSSCRRLHSLLPDILVPCKHYASNLITTVLDEDIIPEEPVNEDYPCEETMRRWKHWFIANRLRAGGYCRNVARQMPAVDREPLLSAASTMDAIRKRIDRWLAAVLRMIYNSGGFLVPE